MAKNGLNPGAVYSPETPETPETPEPIVFPLFYTFLYYLLYPITTDKGKNNKITLMTIFGQVPEFPAFLGYPANRIRGFQKFSAQIWFNLV